MKTSYNLRLLFKRYSGLSFKLIAKKRGRFQNKRDLLSPHSSAAPDLKYSNYLIRHLLRTVTHQDLTRHKQQE